MVQKTEELSHTQSISLLPRGTKDGGALTYPEYLSITPWYKRRRSSHIPRVSLYYPVVQKTEELSHTQSISGSCGYKRQWSSHILRISRAVVGTKDSGALTYPEYLQQLWVRKIAVLSHTQNISGSCGYKSQWSSHISRVFPAVVGTKESKALTYPGYLWQLCQWVAQCLCDTKSVYKQSARPEHSM